jgi:hypothetical protein
VSSSPQHVATRHAAVSVHPLQYVIPIPPDPRCVWRARRRRLCYVRVHTLDTAEPRKDGGVECVEHGDCGLAC